MSKRHLASLSTLAVVIGLVSLAGLEVGAQATAPAAQPATAAAKTSPRPRTPAGGRDLQGTWSFATITPVERPDELAGKALLTAEDVANAEAEAKAIATEQVGKRKTNITTLLDTTPREGNIGFYNQFWLEQGTKVLGTRQTSLIVDPPNGKLPPFTPEGARKQAALTAARDRNAGPEDRSLGDRCIVGFNAGPPMVPGAYNNNVQIFQGAGYVALVTEMVHSARIVPMDGRPHGTTRQWSGDSRGRWEGDTLVIDTINFRDEGVGAERQERQGTDKNLHLVERFKRLDADTLLYQFTVDDPTIWTKPWTASMTMSKSSELVFEYACHEGNYAMRGILAGARSEEQEAAAKKGKE